MADLHSLNPKTCAKALPGPVTEGEPSTYPRSGIRENDKDFSPSRAIREPIRDYYIGPLRLLLSCPSSFGVGPLKALDNACAFIL